MAKAKEVDILKELKILLDKEFAKQHKTAKKKVKTATGKIGEAEEFIKNHPFQSVGAAFLMGYFLGNFRRR